MRETATYPGPPWTDGRDEAPLEPLTGDVAADVCVVGAGVTGLTTAYLAARAGMRVVVLDDGHVGGGETGRTTAQVTAVLDTRYEVLERLHGTDGARRAAESHSAAIDRISALVAEERIACGFERVDGYLFGAAAQDVSLLDGELLAARRAGLAVERVERVPWPRFETGPALRFPAQGQLSPHEYADGLARAVRRRGGRIFTGSHVVRLEDERPARVVCAAGPVVTADAVVVATHSPVFDVVTLHTKQAARRTYVVGLPIPAGSVPRALCWDASDRRGDPDPYHYVRSVAGLPGDDDLLLVGGEDHRTGQADDAEARYDALVRWARERFPDAGAPGHRWSGQVLDPVDGLGFVGKNPGSVGNVYVVTGHGGNGMTHATLAGLILADRLAGRSHPWADLYDPGRVSLRSAVRYVRQNASAVRGYGRWFAYSDVDSPDEIPRLRGAVVRRGLRRVAVYRDADGALHERSAACPHLGCVVRWNLGESTWDCPCHGSRFTALGEVLHGPANRDLALVEPPTSNGPEDAEAKARLDDDGGPRSGNAASAR